MADNDDLALAQAWLKRHGFSLADAQVADPARLATTAAAATRTAAERLAFGEESLAFTAVLESLARKDRRDAQ
jgi:hypothetical protein